MCSARTVVRVPCHGWIWADIVARKGRPPLAQVRTLSAAGPHFCPGPATVFGLLCILASPVPNKTTDQGRKPHRPETQSPSTRDANPIYYLSQVRTISAAGPDIICRRSEHYLSQVRNSALDLRRYSAFCAFWRRRSPTKLRTGDVNPTDRGQYGDIPKAPASWPGRSVMEAEGRREGVWGVLSPISETLSDSS